MTVLRAVASSGVAAVSERVLADLDVLVPRLGEAYRREIPEYAAMSETAMATDVLPVTRRLVTTFLSCLVDDRPPAASELAAFEQSGRERLHMGMPLETVLHAFRIAGREAWSALCAAVAPGEEALLGPLGARWMDVVDRTSSALARAYLTASHERLRDLDSRRRELVEALLTADDPAEVAAVSLRFSTALAPSYVPVLVAGSGGAAGIDALLASAPAGTLGGHRWSGGADRVLLLVPGPPGRLARPGAVVAWGRAAACGRALLDEVRSVEVLLATALAEGHVEGAFGPDDLLVEQLLLGNERVAGALRRRVVDVLHERDAAGVVVPTLQAYLATGSVPETARREHVHPNTVSYRLSRVRELTGLDPRVPREAALLVLGLGLPS
ncbi:MAG TPA: helix-turn-helix domain-containing protein [Mycobacteriales bacterium]|nr:helix-turn-helix domain-containing protein [Mycobacteriales bacterium]